MAGYNNECWYDLANAIVLSAVEDWRHYMFQLQFPSLQSKQALDISRQCERFFLSKYFRILTDLDGKTFLRRLKESFDFSDPSPNALAKHKIRWMANNNETRYE